MPPVPSTSATVAMLIATCNDGPWLEPSVRSALAQTYVDLKVIVIDDGSSDGSVGALRSVIQDERLMIIAGEGKGKAAALNRARALTDAEFIAIQDGDDISHPQRIERQVACLTQQPEIAACFTGHGLLYASSDWDDLEAPVGQAMNAAEVASAIADLRMPAHDPTAMYRSAAIQTLEFDVDLHVGQGFDFNLRLGERAPMVVLGDCLYGYRIRAGSNTRRNNERRQDFVEGVLRRACRRRGCSARQLDDVIERSRRHARRASRDNNLAAHYIESVLSARTSGNIGSAVLTALRGVGRRPFDWKFYKPVAFAVTPQRLIAAHRSRRGTGGAASPSVGGASTTSTPPNFRTRINVRNTRQTMAAMPSVSHPSMTDSIAGSSAHVDTDVR